ncbi:lovastatin nonaketide synthase [Verticillium alfalfae VaMs.102]|uniref:Lovastatin nonaketide synthase n=1 Tax=Verticillium alfalfae (strain VaMs.102 / ATCC MYA-4576 / FGSC 10136) TaxID=526221 RepID=C9SB55_VERA1|nr:lovastatin nonaketide synthase [Verticillium alfalfae VaMs.102]EEY15605.1 lovastatin nonaketide synthase [Verticillium alfalfae VaMs.102]
MEPIAIIGMDLKFPGDATDAESFWDMLMEGRSALREIPTDRFNVSAFYHPDPERAGSLNVTKGHFLNGDIAAFDAPFFSITPAEAAGMDPQQRGLLESTYRALENAGQPLEKVTGSKTGVFVGCFTREYEAIMFKETETQQRYFATGTGTTMLANRLSYFYDLRGPSVSLDTACSSSLVACHLACASLRSGECDTALAAGCNLFYNPDTIIPLTALGFLSPDGRCYSFDSRANGYSRGEGFGMVVLKRLSDALRDGDTVRAVIRGSASNQDGRSPGITQPTRQAQVDLIRAAYDAAGLDLTRTRFFEAHGTGTPVGDPIEASAISGAFSEHRSAAEPMVVGAVKTNIGHLEGSAGIAGLIKTVLVLEHGVVPPNTWFEKPNPKIPVDEWHLRFPTKPLLWPGEGLRRASVNAFGYGGSNAHVVLDDALHYLQEHGLRGRHHTAKKATLKKALTNGHAANGVNGHGTNGVNGHEVSDHGHSRHHSTAASLFAADRYLRGIGCAWSLVGELLQDESRSRVADAAFSQPLCTALQVGLVDVLAAWGVRPAAVLGHSSGEIAAAYAVGALSREAAWRLAYHRGALSSALATTTGSDHRRGGMASVAMNAEDATRYFGDKLGVAAVGRDIVVACVNSPRNVTISGNAESVDKIQKALEADGVFARTLQVNNGYHSPLMEPIAEAYRASIGLLDTVDAEDEKSRPVFYSSLTGTTASIADLQSPAYWVQNLTSPVQFSKAFALMCSSAGPQFKKLGSRGAAHQQQRPKISDVLEVGPHAALRGPIREILDLAPQVTAVGYESILRRNTSATDTALTAAGWLWCRGHSIDVATANDAAHEDNPIASSRLLTEAPGYPFNHANRYWNESRISRGYRFRQAIRHELLGAPVPDWDPAHAVWRNYLRLVENPWVKHHRITGATIYPAAGMLVMAIEASRQTADPSRVVRGFRIRDARFAVALRVPSSQTGIETHFYLRPAPRDHPDTALQSVREFALSSYEGGEWHEHCRGLVVTEYEQPPTAVDGGREESSFRQACLETLARVEAEARAETSFRQLYEHLSTVGLDFGATFQTLRDIRCGHDVGAAVATVERQDLEGLMPLGYLQEHLVHPTVLDGILQSIIVCLTKGGRDMNQVMVPSEIGDIWVSASPTAKFESVRVTCEGSFLGMRQAEARIVGVDVVTGEPVCTVDGFVITSVARAETSAEAAASAAGRRLCFDLDWKIDPAFVDQRVANDVFQPDAAYGPTPEQALLIENVEMMCYLYIRRYNDAFLSSPEQEASQRKNSKVGHHAQYFDWIKYQLEKYEAGQVAHAKAEWRQRAADDEYVALMESKLLEEGSPEGKLVVSVGRQLPAILAGEADALELLFQDKLVENVYRSGVGAELGYRRMVSYIDAMAHKNPAMRILEIGAGTGGATRPILECLTTQDTPRFSHYAFTDISIGFFEKARDMFDKDAGGRMSFRALNVEADLADQGFENEDDQYDLIVAANVIHATKSLQKTLTNARKLLRPGGKLMLYEMTNTDMIRTGFAFGLLPGWWLSAEDFRKYTPLASPQDWSAMLKKSGFSGIDVQMYDFPDHRHQMVSVLICSAEGGPASFTAGPGPPTTSNTSSEALTIVVSDSPSSSSLQMTVAENMERSGGTGSKIVGLRDFAALDTRDVQQRRCIFLGDIDSDFLENVQGDEYNALQRLVSTVKTLLWVNQGGGPLPASPGADMVTGFARCMRAENPGLTMMTLSLESASNLDSSISTILRVLQGSGGENSFFASNGGSILIPRITEATRMNEVIAAKAKGGASSTVTETWAAATSGRALKLACDTPGLLDTLQFRDDPLQEQPLGSEDVEVQVHATGLNLLDVMIALGQVTGEAFGQECAGVVTRIGDGVSRVAVGDRVCGLLRGTFKNLARGTQWQFVKLPSSVDHAVGAAMPVVYTTAYYALHDLARLQAGESVLIHWGAGGVGQAAIQLAKKIGADVFVTVGSLEKRDFVHEHYGVALDHVLSSRDLSFVQGVKRLTGGRGVDVILNSTSGQTLRATWDCIAPYGRFVEIGKVDIFANAGLPMAPFKKSVTFSFFDIGLLSLERGPLFGRVLQDVVNLLADGSITPPQPLHAYTYSNIQEAFRIMQAGTHTGKLVLEPRPDDLVTVEPSRKPSYSFPADAAYVLSGGGGGLGRSTARWMASRGAKNLIILSRSGKSRPATQELVKELTQAGVNVVAPQCDVSNREALTAILDECTATMPPIKGCIQGSMVLKDSLFANMTQEDYYTAVRPKVVASRNLHELLPRDMDFFVLLSSASGVVGNRGQSNYCIGNTYQDALARHRAGRGLPGVAVDLGMILSVGFAAENQESMANLRQEGFNAMREDEFLALLDILCSPPDLDADANGSPQIAVGLEVPATLRIKGIPEPAWLHDPLFRQLYQIRGDSNGHGDGDGDGSASSTSCSVLLPAASSLADAAEHRGALPIVQKAVQKRCRRAERGHLTRRKPAFTGYGGRLSWSAVELPTLVHEGGRG